MSSINKTDFIRIVREHQGIINSICKLYYTDGEDIKDARQDIILQLWKSIATFRNDAKLSTWIYSVSLHTVLSKVKKERKNSSHEPLTDLHPDAYPVSAFYESEDVQQLLLFIGRLEAQDKAIMILHLEGYSNKEIAASLKLTATNVSTRMSRIKTKLKEDFKNIYNELK